MKAKDYRTESDIPMHDSKFNIGQMVKMNYPGNQTRHQDYQASHSSVMPHLVQDVSWNALEDSWVYEITEDDGHGLWGRDVLEAELLPL